MTVTYFSQNTYLNISCLIRKFENITFIDLINRYKNVHVEKTSLLNVAINNFKLSFITVVSFYLFLKLYLQETIFIFFQKWISYYVFVN